MDGEFRTRFFLGCWRANPEDHIDHPDACGGASPLGGLALDEARRRSLIGTSPSRTRKGCERVANEAPGGAAFGR
jgi:hypothetical protein